MTTLLTYYSQYQNSYVKHNDSVNEVEINFVVEITSIVPSPFRLSIIFSTLPTKENKFMYVPILRKLNDAVRQIKSADDQSRRIILLFARHRTAVSYRASTTKHIFRYKSNRYFRGYLACFSRSGSRYAYTKIEYTLFHREQQPSVFYFTG